MRNDLALLSGLRFRMQPLPGRARLVDALGKIASRLGGQRAVFSPWVGSRFEVDLSDRIERQMWGGCYEAHVRKCLEALLRKADVFLDIGAHIGYHTVVAACRVGIQGRVFSFEADPGLYERLTRNVRQFPWVCPLQCAAWERSGELSFERSSSEGESGWGTLTAVRDLRMGEHVPVQAVSLDDWCETARLSRLRAIKIDAEGSEVSILQGARRTIERFRPMLLMEMNNVLLRQAGASVTELATHHALENYSLFGLTRLRLHQPADGEAPRAAEALCIPNEQIEATLDRLQRAGFKLC